MYCFLCIFEYQTKTKDMKTLPQEMKSRHDENFKSYCDAYKKYAQSMKQYALDNIESSKMLIEQNKGKQIESLFIKRLERANERLNEAEFLLNRR